MFRFENIEYLYAFAVIPVLVLFFLLMWYARQRAIRKFGDFELMKRLMPHMSKYKHAIKFLSDGAKVKAYVHFVGRTIVFKERGEILLLKFAQALEQYAKVEQLPKLEGKRMFLLLIPKNLKK